VHQPPATIIESDRHAGDSGCGARFRDGAGDLDIEPQLDCLCSVWLISQKQNQKEKGPKYSHNLTFFIVGADRGPLKILQQPAPPLQAVRKKSGTPFKSFWWDQTLIVGSNTNICVIKFKSPHQ
jgi:hypothetical protein